ncbi:MAG TPA: alkaline phosphatase family protein [Solirubrobacteraceae bacterium]|nr:alkaline phosphatase family protein [Solirubrobacteraceae bacterium]
MDHVVLVIFENRSLDNLLGRLYGPEHGKTFDGVIGKDLSNPIPEWAEHAAERKAVPYTIATDMDAPNPDSGEEFFHTNTQLFNILDEHNRFKIGEAVSAPWNAPEPGTVPTMDGFVADYISTFTAEMGRQPTYDEYAQIMTGYTPEQVPVLSTIARDFGVFDHWFCEVPSQTFMNRSFWTAASSSGFAINSPVSNFTQHNAAETLFDRLEAHGRTWKVYVQEPMPLSFTGLIHMPRLKERLATNFVPYSQFERDAAEGTLPDFSLIEPNMLSGHSDYHPAFGRSFVPGDMNLPMDPPSSIRGGEAFLARIYDAIRAAASPEGSNAYDTLFFIGWDEPGGTYDHVPPGAVPPPDPSAPAGQLGFKFDRSGYRVPAIVVSPWVDEGIVINDEYRHTSMIATLRKVWDLGDPLTARDAAAAPFDHLLSRETPRDPGSWPDVEALPVPQFHMDTVQMGRALSVLGKTAGSGMLEHAKQSGIAIPRELTDRGAHPTVEQTIGALRSIAAQVFPLLAQGTLVSQ